MATTALFMLLDLVQHSTLSASLASARNMFNFAMLLEVTPHASLNFDNVKK